MIALGVASPGTPSAIVNHGRPMSPEVPVPLWTHPVPGLCHAPRVRRKRALAGDALAVHTFAAQASLDPAGMADVGAAYGLGEIIFAQGDACRDVLYIRTGGVTLSVLSRTGREATVALLGPGDFFGEGCLSGQRTRMSSAKATIPSVILRVAKGRMTRLLRQEHGMSDRFIAHVLSRNIRIEADLLEHLFNSSEKRLARALLLLARYGETGRQARAVPRLSQQALADAVGTTRARVRFLLTKFKKLGFIEYDGQIPIAVNQSLLNVVLHD